MQSKAKLAIKPEAKQTSKTVTKEEDTKLLTQTTNLSSKTNGQTSQRTATQSNVSEDNLKNLETQKTMPIPASKEDAKASAKQRNLSKQMTMKVNTTKEMTLKSAKTHDKNSTENFNNLNDSLKDCPTDRNNTEGKSCNNSVILKDDADGKGKMSIDMSVLSTVNDQNKAQTHRYDSKLMIIDQNLSVSFVPTSSLSTQIKIKRRNVKKVFKLKKPKVNPPIIYRSLLSSCNQIKEKKKGISVFSTHNSFGQEMYKPKNVTSNQNMEKFKVFFDTNFNSSDPGIVKNSKAILSINYKPVASATSPQTEYLNSLKKNQYKHSEVGFGKLINPINQIEKGWIKDKDFMTIDTQQKNNEEKRKLMEEMKTSSPSPTGKSKLNFKQKVMSIQKGFLSK